MSSFDCVSSCRRRTRCLCDWSSDVCSSVLCVLIGDGGETARTVSGVEIHAIGSIHPGSQEMRSEERRVGKECRSRLMAEHQVSVVRGNIGRIGRNQNWRSKTRLLPTGSPFT